MPVGMWRTVKVCELLLGSEQLSVSAVCSAEMEAVSQRMLYQAPVAWDHLTLLFVFSS